MIPLCDVTQQYQDLKPDIDAAVEAVLAGGQYILGPNVKAFEQEFANYLGCNHAVGVGNGTDALHLALRALGVGPGNEVITTPFTFIASTEAIGLVGATPVFVDVDPHTYNIDPNRIEAAITPRTKAILPVHLYGQPCDMDAIMQVAAKHAIPVVEDCAQAIGATYKGQRVGTFGVAGCFSFFPTKNLGCCGDGGMVVSNEARMFERVEMLRRHGGRKKYHHEELGLNSRLDELQAAILRIKLQHLDRWNCRRRERAYRYNELFALLSSIERPAEIGTQNLVTPTAIYESSDLLEAVYHQYTVLIDDRDTVQTAFNRAGIGCAAYYPVPLHRQIVHHGLGYRGGSFPVAERVSRQCLSLPMFSELTDEQQSTVAGALAAAIAPVAHKQRAA
jgi:dTDP-4-amino-4,6-dideoxygalactose transaminase